jgi:D-alanyl-D-alanine dipeptidase
MNSHFSSSKNIGLIWLTLFCFPLLTPAQVFPSDHYLDSREMERVDTLNGVVVDIKYSTTDNFLDRNVYDGYKKIWLHKEAAHKLKTAIKWLKADCAKCKFILFDGLRPRSVQKVLKEVANKQKKGIYVGRPYPGSMHNFGMAIDISIMDSLGNEIDMGTPYDYFGPLAQPKLEDEMLQKGSLTQVQINNRAWLRRIMTFAGWVQLPIEWWHFNAFNSKYVRKNYKVIE